MHRSKLYAAIKNAVTLNGYNFHSGFEYHINATPAHFPIAWLSPPQVSDVEGRREGYITYSVTMHLMQIVLKVTPTLKDERWGAMEVQAMDIIAAIREDTNIFNVQKIRMSPAEFSLSKHGEISMEISFEASMHFLKS